MLFALNRLSEHNKNSLLEFVEIHKITVYGLYGPYFINVLYKSMYPSIEIKKDKTCESFLIPLIIY